MRSEAQSEVTKNPSELTRDSSQVNDDREKTWNAEIQGETHFSKKDRQTLLDLDLSQFDAVYSEGSESNFSERKFTIGYTLFVVGCVLYNATFARIYESSEEFEAHVAEADIPFYKIDAKVHEIYGMMPRWKRALLLIVSPIYTAVIIGTSSTLIVAGVGFLPIGLPPWIPIIGGFTFLLFFGLAWPLGFFNLFIVGTMDSRDEYMAETAMSISYDNEYENVLLSCGDAHRKGIGSRLTNDEWDIDPHPTKSWFGRPYLWIERVLEVIANPMQSGKRLISWAKSL